MTDRPGKIVSGGWLLLDVLGNLDQVEVGITQVLQVHAHRLG